jgi:mannose-6-phosphate isomerase-like protein (cupin superfamily)
VVARGTSIKYVRTPSGEGSARGFHTHASPQYLYVLAGQLVVEIEGEEPITAGPDTCVLVPPLVSHRTANMGHAPCSHLSIGA